MYVCTTNVCMCVYHERVCTQVVDTDGDVSSSRTPFTPVQRSPPRAQEFERLSSPGTSSLVTGFSGHRGQSIVQSPYSASPVRGEGGPTAGAVSFSLLGQQSPNPRVPRTSPSAVAVKVREALGRAGYTAPSIDHLTLALATYESGEPGKRRCVCLHVCLCLYVVCALYVGGVCFCVCVGMPTFVCVYVDVVVCVGFLL